MELTIGFSPCPNDTFIFDALVNKKIDTEGIHFNVVLEDVETLNQWAFESKLDITKLSFPSFFRNTGQYILLNSGSALGNGVGPILISKKEIEQGNGEIENCLVALPGEHTTANLLFSFAFPDAGNKIFMRFDKIEEAVLSSRADAGVIIHENRFTYEQKGLKKIIDLGDFWEKKTQLPIPLGGIAAKKSLGKPLLQKINALVKSSIEFAFQNYPNLPIYVTHYAQEMDEQVMRKHIELYVNNFSLDLGTEGKQSINTLYSIYAKENLITTYPSIEPLLFL